MAKLFPLPSKIELRLGNTPLYRLDRTVEDPLITLYLKMECRNPSGSIKDRAIHHIFSMEGQKSGGFTSNKSIIASRGNSALSLALFARARGMDPIVFCPDSISQVKSDLLKKLGTTLHLSPHHLPAGDSRHYYEAAKLFAQENPEMFFIDLYNNYRNPEAYYLTLGPEIWEATGGKIDYLVAATSTGGSISGTSRFLKEKKPSIKTILADPIGSLYSLYFQEGRLPKSGRLAHEKDNPKSETGSELLGKVIDFSVIDEVMTLSTLEVAQAERHLLSQEGIIVGPGSLLALSAAMKLAERIQRGSVTIVALMRDSCLV